MRKINHSSRFIEQFGTPHNAEWPLLSFAEFASIDAQMTDDFEAYADSPHIGIDSIEQNTGKILNYRTVSEDSVKSGKYIFTRNHIIYSKIRPNLNKVAEPDFDGLCSADAYPLLAKEKVCKKRFLAIILRSDDFLSYIVPLSNRTGMPKANREQLEGYSFRMPPVDIQDAFLSIVEQADKSKFSDFKSRFIEMFRTSQTVTIGSMFETTSGGTPSSKQKEYYDGGTIPWLTSGEVAKGKISDTAGHITELGLLHSSAKWVPVNTVVIAMYGATVGKVGLLTIPCTTNQAICSVLPKESVNPLYLYHAIKSKETWMSEQAVGAAQPNISQAVIRKMKIPMPCKDLQDAFVRLAEQADKSKYLN